MGRLGKKLPTVEILLKICGSEANDVNPTPRLANTYLLHTVRRPSIVDYINDMQSQWHGLASAERANIFELSAIKYRNCRCVRGTVCYVQTFTDCILHTDTVYCTECSRAEVRKLHVGPVCEGKLHTVIM